MTKKQYWLFKSEPVSYSIDHLAKDGTTSWSGVRNFQARNFMREMNIGDTVLFYHSSCAVPGVYGIAKVASLAYPDLTQFDSNSPYYEPRATKEKPVWDLVDISFVKKVKTPLSLAKIRESTALENMIVLRPRNRLSITPVTKEEYEAIVSLTSV